MVPTPGCGSFVLIFKDSSGDLFSNKCEMVVYYNLIADFDLTGRYSLTSSWCIGFYGECGNTVVDFVLNLFHCDCVRHVVYLPFVTVYVLIGVSFWLMFRSVLVDLVSVLYMFLCTLYIDKIHNYVYLFLFTMYTFLCTLFVE